MRVLLGRFFAARPHVMEGIAWLGASCALIFFAERRWPLRERREPVPRHLARNLLIAASGALALAFIERPVVSRLSRLAQRRRWGLCRLGSPKPIETTLAVLLLDYSLYGWHVLTHRVSWLWRFHRVHHADRDMDASTALRFHFGELALSVPFRALQVVVIGVSPRALALWQRLLLLSITFHHANLRLPWSFERRLCRVVMTPRLHGRHHDPREAVRNANWSSGLTLWDRLHGTLRTDAEAHAVGVDDLPHPEDVTAAKLLTMPFHRRVR